jgi:antitoxin component YwqK of YwqJK toxin-antitoxin module
MKKIEMDDLVKRDGLYYRKFTNVPFSGTLTGEEQGTIKDGVRIGRWVSYHDNGQLGYIGTFKDGVRIGRWLWYDKNGKEIL